MTVTYPGNLDIRVTDAKTLSIGDDLEASIYLTSGLEEVYVCPPLWNNVTTSFRATVIGSRCDDFTFTWIYTHDGGASIEFGSGPDVSHLFRDPGLYEIHCVVSNSCGDTARSNHVTFSVIPYEEEYCEN